MSIFSSSKPSVFEATAVLTISGATHSGGYVTVTTSASHGLVAGDAVHISGVVGMTDLNAIWEVYDTPLTTTFRVVLTTAQTYTSGGDIRNGYWFKNCTFEYDFVQPAQLNFRSVITGKKTNTHLGDYGMFRVNERLWQGSTVARTTTNKFQQLYNLYHTDVWFFPHSNKTILDSVSNVVTCYFKSFKPFYYRDLINYDGVVCEFEVNEYYDVSKLI